MKHKKLSLKETFNMAPDANQVLQKLNTLVMINSDQMSNPKIQEDILQALNDSILVIKNLKATNKRLLMTLD